MKTALIFILLNPVVCMAAISAVSFEGTIEASLIRGNHTESYTYSVGPNMLRIERNETDDPYAINLVDLKTGEITLIFPHNRSFMRVKPRAETRTRPPGFPAMPMPSGGLPPGIGPQALLSATSGASPSAEPVQIGPRNLPGVRTMPDVPDMPEIPNMVTPPNFPEMPAGMRNSTPLLPSISRQATPTAPFAVPDATAPPMPPGPMKLPGMPPMPSAPNLASGIAEGLPMPGMMAGSDGGPEGGFPGELPLRRSGRKLRFNSTDETTDLLGYTCTRYELRQRNRTMVIWATDQLFPFQKWRHDPPRRQFGPPILEQSWAELLRTRHLFPLRIEMRSESGETLLFAFEVVSINLIQSDAGEATLFQPPTDYYELHPPRF